MSVLMQAFYWYCPRDEDREYKWWNLVREEIPWLASAGFSALWLPPIHKAANLHGPSMGYDPYDYYDIGDLDQKGSVPTWFGTRAELLELMGVAHAAGMRVLADMVINHNAGADAEEMNPITGKPEWTLFHPKSGRFPRNAECFTPNRFEPADPSAFGGFPDLSHANPYVHDELLALARWMVEELGFDGFRFDYAKGYPASTVRDLMLQSYRRSESPIAPLGIAEYWEPAESTLAWLADANAESPNPVAAFDFPLRESLKVLCDQPGIGLREIISAPSILASAAERAVTFVESHDLRDQGRPIENDKLLAYSFILTHAGLPCVYWKDYYKLGLALRNTPNGIDALIRAREAFAGGETEVLHLDDHLYIMQRTGDGMKPGLIFVLNSRADDWSGAWVRTKWDHASFRPAAWWSRIDVARPIDQATSRDGRGQFFAPPRGFAVYIPG